MGNVLGQELGTMGSGLGSVSDVLWSHGISSTMLCYMKRMKDPTQICIAITEMYFVLFCFE